MNLLWGNELLEFFPSDKTACIFAHFFRSGTTDSIHGATKNIWGSPLQYNIGECHNIENFKEWRIAGGSSGGSAVAVATGSVFA